MTMENLRESRTIIRNGKKVKEWMVEQKVRHIHDNTCGPNCKQQYDIRWVWPKRR